MRVHDDELTIHLTHLYNALSAKPVPTLDEQSYLWLLADTLFSLTLDMTWDAVAEQERDRLDVMLKAAGVGA